MKGLLLFSRSVTPRFESQEFVLFTYFEKTGLVDRVDEAVGCVNLLWSGDEEVHHSLGRGTGILKRRVLGVVEWFATE